MIDFTKPVETRSGKKVRILCTDSKGGYPIVGLIEREKYEEAAIWTLDGHFIENFTSHNNNLVNVEPVQSVFHMLYKKKGALSVGFARSTIESCRTCSGPENKLVIQEIVYKGTEILETKYHPVKG